MSSSTAPDLEAGPSRTRITGTQSRPQHRAPDRPKDDNIFVKDAGQSLLIAFDSHKNKDASAILVPVFRPSVEWARSMAAMEDKGETLPVKAPEKADFDIDRWREFRWLHCGEDEVDVWKRIKQQYLAQQPRWYSFLPFWRPFLVEERNLLLHSREGAIYRVEIEPAIDLQEERRKADVRLRQANEKLESCTTEGDSCHGDFDAFGEFFSKYHGTIGCRKRLWTCHIETFVTRKSERDRMERKHDFMSCFSNPAKASTVYPLTVGRVLGSCIHDNSITRNRPLPNREHPNRLPPRTNGLVVKYHFRSTRIELEIVSSSLFVGAVVLIWRFATGDWNVAAAFGSLCVALMALGHQRSRKADGTMVKSTKTD